nr:MAG TPA: hypothetical protein [Caudoviricetes sp.]DAT61126.1 MAG TPA: hypothetical protein [Caudoviricetes sp.]
MALSNIILIFVVPNRYGISPCRELRLMLNEI